MDSYIQFNVIYFFEMLNIYMLQFFPVYLINIRRLFIFYYFI